MITDYRLTIDVDDIYFLIRLSHWGVDISLFGSRVGGDTTDGYLQCFCRGAPPKDGWIDIQSIELLPLRTIVSLLENCVAMLPSI